MPDPERVVIPRDREDDYGEEGVRARQRFLEARAGETFIADARATAGAWSNAQA